MTTSDIQAEIEDIYGITISPSMVSRITDKVMDSAIEWQNRTLDKNPSNSLFRCNVFQSKK